MKVNTKGDLATNEKVHDHNCKPLDDSVWTLNYFTYISILLFFNSRQVLNKLQFQIIFFIPSCTPP